MSDSDGIKPERIDDALWFLHKDGTRFYPWLRHSKHHGRCSLWVSDGSNRIEDATAVATIADLVVEVFSRERSVWLRAHDGRTGLYRYGHDAIQGWGAIAEVQPLALRAGAPRANGAATPRMPALVSKALADTGYDLLAPRADGWTRAAVSGSPGEIYVAPTDEGVLLVVPEPGMAERIGLTVAAAFPAPPPGMPTPGLARGAMPLYEALRLLRSLQAHPASMLSARVEARLSRIPETERTRQVRQRVGQDVFREALMDLWQGRCAVTGIAFPPQLLRASHAKPWSQATDAERLDPFNGLLLCVHLDAMFDGGLIAFDDAGRILVSSELDPAVRSYLGLDEMPGLGTIAPGHVPYLAWHRTTIFRG